MYGSKGNLVIAGPSVSDRFEFALDERTDGAALVASIQTLFENVDQANAVGFDDLLLI